METEAGPFLADDGRANRFDISSEPVVSYLYGQAGTRGSGVGTVFSHV